MPQSADDDDDDLLPDFDLSLDFDIGEGGDEDLLAEKVPTAAGARDGIDLVADAYDGPEMDGSEPNYEKATAQELGEVALRMKAIQVAADARRKDNMDVGYFCGLVFLNHAQMRAFLTAAGWDTLSSGGPWVNGVALAAKMGIDLPPAAYNPLTAKTTNDAIRRVKAP
jgi:hypothetical protein